MSRSLDDAARALRTIRHLRLRQVSHLLWRRLRGLPAPTAPSARWAHERGMRVATALAALGPVGGADAAAATARALLRGRLEMLGHDLPWDGDWMAAGPSPLWRYHLHYHDHLADLAWLAASERDDRATGALASALAGWWTAWSGGGTPAWDPYPTSVRLVNWVRILGWAGGRLPADVRARLERGIAQQVRHLARTLEWHLDGNHLLRNAWALVVGALCLDDAGAERRARALFARLMREQVHEDGWHEEHSPMYHVRALRDAREVAVAATAAGAPLDDTTRAIIDRMAAALPWMRRGDGALWLRNDAAQDHGVDLAPLLAAAPAAAGVRHFADAGAVVAVDPASGDRVRVDLGAPSPPHQPAHAHAGALGFELDLAGVPLVCDRGCSGYDGDPWRPYLRGSAAHSTVVIAGRDQSELWATFRVGGRAAVATHAVSGDAQALRVEAECRPYHAPSVVHRRALGRAGREVRIDDTVHGAGRRTVEAFVHFAPSWDAASAGAGRVVLTHRALSASLVVEGAVEATLHRGERAPVIGWHAERFGGVTPAWSLRLRATGGDAAWSIRIRPD